MNKTVIALLGASALVLSTAGIAGGTTTVPATNMDANNAAGFYISGNLGYGYTDQKNISETLNYNNGITGSVNTKYRNGFAWMTAIGYQFNSYVAVELGGMQFANVKIDVSATDGINTSSASLTTKTYATYIDAKGIYPINSEFNAFAKVGLAYLSHSFDESDDANSITVLDSEHHITPLLGLGVSYNINQNLAVDVQGIATVKSGNGFPATYTGLVGLTYKFS